MEITGGRDSDQDARRRSTAAKIVIGRDEIEKFGDATVGEVLRRLPGVTVPGAPGRGGGPRMRGLGGGYTQLLLDGQRVPPGFSLESLTPEQIERIEILRAPTAETGARAIAGTINIITREGFRRRLNDWRLGLSVENGQVTPGTFWTHNDSTGNLTYNISGAVFRPWRESSSQTHTTITGLPGGAVAEDRVESSNELGRHKGLHLTGRLQWRLGEAGDSLLLVPSLYHNEGTTRRDSSVDASVGVPDYDRSQLLASSRSTSARLNTQWRQRLGESRLELHGGLGGFEYSGDYHVSYLGAGALPPKDERVRIHDRSASLTAKLSTLLGAAGDVERAHSLVTGIELEALKRDEERQNLLGGALQLQEFEPSLSASSLRVALYAQDEWALDKHWALHAGLRGEAITTKGEAAGGVEPRNHSAVWTPLVHVLWKPDPAKRDQIRLSLTRSYRSPALGLLIAQRSANSRAPEPGPNTELTADSAGNPKLRPELARGLDLAFERYLDGGGVLSANLFARRVQDLMRRVVALEVVDTGTGAQRWVARQQNVGSATSVGLELEAKFRLDQLSPGALPVELRSNLSLYRSRVDDVPGPDNRLDGQGYATANFGADYRLRGLPLTLGGNLNWVPGYRTQLSAEQATTVSTKRVFDAYALWTFSPAVAVRLLASNLAPQDFRTSSVYETAVQRLQATTGSETETNWQLRLELKL